MVLLLRWCADWLTCSWLLACRNEDGTLTFSAGNVCIHFYTVDFLATKCNPDTLPKEYHIARKKIPLADEETGELLFMSMCVLVVAMSILVCTLLCDTELTMICVLRDAFLGYVCWLFVVCCSLFAML